MKELRSSHPSRHFPPILQHNEPADPAAGEDGLGLGQHHLKMTQQISANGAGALGKRMRQDRWAFFIEGAPERKLDPKLLSAPYGF